jgi:hypothetical protein
MIGFRSRIFFDDLKPFADMKDAVLPGFKLTLSEKIFEYIGANGFNAEALTEVVRRMVKG